MNRKIIKTFPLILGTVIMFSGTAIALENIGSDNRGGAKKEAIAAHLEGVKLKACQNRERAINNILDRIATRGEKRLSVYDSISQKVQDFYAAKNISISNYDELLAGVNAKKEAATAAIDTAKNDNVSFTCDGSDPKAAASGFKVDLKAEIKALHEYQQSIKDFIVAIKTSIGSSNTTDSGESD